MVSGYAIFHLAMAPSGLPPRRRKERGALTVHSMFLDLCRALDGTGWTAGQWIASTLESLRGPAERPEGTPNVLVHPPEQRGLVPSGNILGSCYNLRYHRTASTPFFEQPSDCRHLVTQTVKILSAADSKGPKTMADTRKCPSCGQPNEADATFCQFCGKSVVPICPQCGAANAPEAVHCKKCGVKLTEAMVGLSPERAREWSRFFEGCGYYTTPDGWVVDYWNQTLSFWEDPLLYESGEVNVVNWYIGKDPWWAKSLDIHYPPEHIAVPGVRHRVKKGVILITNRRLLAYDMGKGVTFTAGQHVGERNDYFPIDYKELVGASTQGDTIILRRQDGVVYQLALKVYHLTAYDKFMGFTASPVIAGVGIMRRRQVEEATRAAADGLASFFTEVVGVVSEWRKHT